MLTPPAIWFPAIRCGSGADTFTERLAAALRRQGLRAEITWLPHRAEYAPWSVVVPKPPAWATIVHGNSWLPRRFVPNDLPVVMTVHGWVHDTALAPFKSPLQTLYHRHWIAPLERANLQRAQSVVAVSRYTAEQVRAAIHRAITVIPNAIDTQRFTPLPRLAPQRPFRLLYVGNWSARKGVDLLGPIMASLGEEFMLYYTADRHGQHTRYALPHHCVNLGRLTGDALLHAYQTADALLFPSRLEGLPLTVLEAMACGVPVIAASVASLPEVIEHGVTGWLCATPSAEAFAAACRQLASDTPSWQAMRHHARQRAVTHFSESMMVARYLEVYRVLSLRKPGNGCTTD